VFKRFDRSTAQRPSNLRGRLSRKGLDGPPSEGIRKALYGTSHAWAKKTDEFNGQKKNKSTVRTAESLELQEDLEGPRKKAAGGGDRSVESHGISNRGKKKGNEKEDIGLAQENSSRVAERGVSFSKYFLMRGASAWNGGNPKGNAHKLQENIYRRAREKRGANKKDKKRRDAKSEWGA